jgi:hypothetical protein
MIKQLHDHGMGYRKIAQRLNEYGYKTARGKRFANTNVFSILKRKRLRDERIGKEYELEYGKLSMRFVDRTIVNDV